MRRWRVVIYKDDTILTVDTDRSEWLARLIHRAAQDEGVNAVLECRDNEWRPA